VIDDGKSGILFRRGNIGDLSAKIISVAGDPAMRAAIGKAARQSAMNYDFARLVTSYEIAVRELADQSAVVGTSQSLS
jgi:glycosyltransferase involved in cell wall biosynthesis